MSFHWPLVLAALAALPILVALYIDRDRRRVASQAQFGNPDLLPNVVDRTPGRLRYLPPLVLLLALALMIVGVARPHATVTVPREEATIVLAIDVSRSMKATDVQPTRLDAARIAAKTFLDEVPTKFQVGVVSFATRAVVAVPPTNDRALVTSALDSLTPGEGTAIGDAVALSLRVGQPKDPSVRPPPRAIVVISDGARDGGQVAPDDAAQQAKRQGVPVYSVLVGTQNGVVTEQLTGGYRRIIRVPPDPATLRQVAETSGGEFFSAPDAEGLRRVYEELGSRLGTRKEDREITDVFAAAATILLLTGASLSAFLFKRVPVRVAAALGALLVAGAAALVLALPAGAANECAGLQVCVPVTGPWVVVPASTTAPRSHVEWQLTCPRRHIVGGLDARLSVPAIDVAFLGTLGSPVNPGITTSRSVVFVATYAGHAQAAPTFRPLIGCMPSSGGGARVPTAFTTFPPGRPVTRRVSTVRVRPGSKLVVQQCARGERLIGGSHAFAFATRTPPSASLVSSISGSEEIRAASVAVRVRGDAELAGVRALVQVQALCSRSR